MKHSMLQFGVVALGALAFIACGDSGGGGPEPTSSSSSFVPSEALDVTASMSALDDSTVLYVWDNVTPTGPLSIGPHVHVQVLSCIALNDRLTIEAGSVFTFAENGCIEVGENGLLEVKGVLEDSVYFLNKTPGKHWGSGAIEDWSGGIWIGSDAQTGSSISYAVFDSAKTAVFVQREEGVKIAHSHIRNSLFHGLHLYEGIGLQPSGMAQCEFSNNQVYDVYVKDPGNLLRMDGSGVFHGSQPEIAVENQGEIDRDGVIPAFTVPYRIMDALRLRNDLTPLKVTIAAGAQFRFMEGAYLEVANNATLVVAGTAEQPVQMKSAEPGKYWGYRSMPDYSGGIWIQAEAGTENEISYLELDSATTGIMIQRENGLKMDHSTLSSNLYFAIHAYAENSLLANGLAYNKFENNGVHHVMVQPSDMVHWGAGNTFVGDSKGVLVDYGVLSESGTLIKLDVPYYIQDYMVVENPSSNITLTIEPGAHLLFSEMAYIQMDERATLHAVGTASDSIVMDEAAPGKNWGFGDDPTYAGGLWLRTLSGSGHHLEYVSIRNAKTGVYVEEGSSLAIDHSSVVESQFYGWIKETGATVNMGAHMNFSGNLVGDY